jgi:hypothetical protein
MKRRKWECCSWCCSNIMRNCVHGDHIALQLKLKNHSNIIVLQLNLPKCNSYATTLYKCDDLINKLPHQKIN